jgi:hypothetical protein
MREAQGTWVGALLDDQRTTLSGWVEPSYTFSSAARNNQPMVWNDRANEFLLQQAWFRLDRPVVTTGTTQPTVGYRLDVLYGSDYRFTLPRGLLNDQLKNSTGAQNLYGVDPIQFYVNAYFPNLFQGTEIRLGRCYCPFGYESNEAISTPLLSRAYDFNTSPFTHCGLMALTTFSPKWSANLMLVNGNDVFFADPAEELRFVGKLQWTSPDRRDSVAVSTSLGRGKFNAGEPFAPATVATANEPAGRNNVNVFDVIWTHAFDPRLSYALETTFGYEYGVPANVPGGIIKEDATEGTMHWAAAINYLTYVIDPHWSALTRVEFFDDFEGQRTGFEGLYSVVTAGLQYRPYKGLWIRPEVRYDYNNESRPFEGKHWLLTVAGDVIVRW